MNKEQRQKWIERAWWLCGSCRYVRIYGPDDDYDCTHPLAVVAARIVDIVVDSDCWGFRPQKGAKL